MKEMSTVLPVTMDNTVDSLSWLRLIVIYNFVLLLLWLRNYMVHVIKVEEIYITDINIIIMLRFSAE